jgi:hypothetical protein
MRDAADLVCTHGAHLGDRQDDLIAGLGAPYAPRIQRTKLDGGITFDGAKALIDFNTGWGSERDWPGWGLVVPNRIPADATDI